MSFTETGKTGEEGKDGGNPEVQFSCSMPEIPTGNKMEM